MEDNRNYNNFEPNDEVGDRQHINPDGRTDAEKAANMGGVGGALTGAAAGAMTGPLGAVAGAVIGGVVGAVASGAAVAAVDTVDGDSTNDHFRAAMDNDSHEKWGDPRLDEFDLSDLPSYWDDRTDLPERRFDLDAPIAPETRHDLTPLTAYYDTRDEPVGNGIPGIQTGGHATDGTPDTRGMSEKFADAVTGDRVDDKTEKRVS